MGETPYALHYQLFNSVRDAAVADQALMLPTVIAGSSASLRDVTHKDGRWSRSVNVWHYDNISATVTARRHDSVSCDQMYFMVSMMQLCIKMYEELRG